MGDWWLKLKWVRVVWLSNVVLPVTWYIMPMDTPRSKVHSPVGAGTNYNENTVLFVKGLYVIITLKCKQEKRLKIVRIDKWYNVYGEFVNYTVKFYSIDETIILAHSYTEMKLEELQCCIGLLSRRPSASKVSKSSKDLESTVTRHLSKPTNM